MELNTDVTTMSIKYDQSCETWHCTFWQDAADASQDPTSCIVPLI